MVRDGAVVEKMKIKSYKDRKKLDEAKHEVYNKGFYEGIMKVRARASTRTPLLDIEGPCAQ